MWGDAQHAGASSSRGCGSFRLDLDATALSAGAVQGTAPFPQVRASWDCDECTAASQQTPHGRARCGHRNASATAVSVAARYRESGSNALPKRSSVTGWRWQWFRATTLRPADEIVVPSIIGMMDTALQQRIDRYADNAFKAQYQTIVEKSNQEMKALTPMGQGNSAYSQHADDRYIRLYAQRISNTVLAKAEALMDAYEIYGAPLDDRILTIVTGFKDESVAGMASGVKGQLSLEVMRINRPQQQASMIGEQFHRRITRHTSHVLGQVFCQIEQRKIDPKFKKREPTPAVIREDGTPEDHIDDDHRFALMAIEEALKSVPEDERPHPKVGAVVVKEGKVLGKAHRGEKLKSHAEYIALEDKLADDLVAGATVYTTLEPCTTRKHPKIPCARRLVDRKVARVVIGMLDPNPEIRGLGEQLLSEAGIETQLFPRELKAQVEEMNREFIRVQKQRRAATNTTQIADQAAMSAARSLTEATWDLQQAAWSFHALRSEFGVIRAAGDFANEEKQILRKIDSALRVFTRDYDLPAELAAVARLELSNINIALVNLKAFSMTGQPTQMDIVATQIQDACHRVRTAAKPFAYRPSV
jgi:pyrimidine deaminase RibD-like protein